MREIWLSNTAGRIPTVNQLEIATAQIGYNRTDAKLYGLRVIDGVKTVVLLGQSTEANHDRLHSMVSAADHAAVTNQYKGMIPQADPATGEWKLVPMPAGGGNTNYNRIISGTVTWIENLDFWVSVVVYIFDGNNYATIAQLITLDPSDPDLNRTDSICVDINSEVVVLTGTPSETPVKPVPDSFTQLELTQVYIPAGATEPSNITVVPVYNENIEWTTSDEIADPYVTEVDFESIVAPFLNTKCILVEITGENGIKKLKLFFNSSEAVSLSDDATLSMQIRSSSEWSSDSGIAILFKLAGVPVGMPVILRGNGLYGNTTMVSGWHYVTIPIADFEAAGNVDEIEMRFSYTDWGAIGFNIGIDDIKIQGGVGITPPAPTQIQSDWDQVDNTQVDFIKNKPTIPDALVPTDDILYWDATSKSYKPYAAQGAGGKFDSSLSNPSHYNRLNYDGKLYAQYLTGVGGVTGISVNASGVVGQSENSAGVNAMTSLAVSNSISDALVLIRNVSVTPQNGIGAGIGFYIKNLTYQNVFAGRLAMKLIDVRSTYLSANFELYLQSTNILLRKLAVSHLGKLTLDTYGAGTHTGTATKTLQVDASGNVIEGDSVSQFPIDINRFGFLNQTETTISFNPTTFVFTLASVGASWSYYRAGLKHTITGNKTVTLAGSPPTTGMYYIYIDSTDGTLTSGAAWTLNDTKVPVAVIYFNDALTPKYQLSEERHTCLIDRRMHLYEHMTSGTKLISGGAVSGYTLNSDVEANKTFAVSQAVIADEDILNTLTALADPDGATNAYVIAYKSAGVWIWEDAQVPFRYTTSGYIQYNAAGTMTEGAGNKFYNTYLFLSNIVGSARFLIIHGESEFSTAATAYTEVFSSFNLSGFITNEGLALYQLTWKTSAAYSTKGKCVLDRVQRISTNIVSTSQSIVDNPWDIQIDGSDSFPIYHTASLNSYKGLSFVSGENMLITYASAVNGFLQLTFASTGGGAGVTSWNTRTGAVSLLKADVEAVLTGAITSHTHAYDNYQYWRVAWYNVGTDGTEYFNIASTKSFEIVAGAGIVMSQPTVLGDITSQVISAEVTTANSVRKLASFYTDAANSGTGETTAYTYTLPANTLTTNGQFIEIDFYGEAANNTNTKSIRVNFGSVNLALMQNSIASSLTRWHISYKIIRVSSTQLRVSQNLTWNFGTQCDTQDSAPVSFTTANAINLTLQGGASSDLITKSATITIYP